MKVETENIILTGKLIRWGIIGCGSVAHRFMQGLNAVPATQLVATWSRTPSSVQSFVDQHGGSACTTIHELLSLDIDAVYIATLPDSHAFYSKAALAAGKHVLCEKPVCLNEGELMEVLKVAADNHLLFMEAMKPPFFPLYQQLKKHLLTDPIGEVGYVRAGSSIVNVGEEHPSLNRKSGGGSMMAIGVYEVFLALDWLGESKNVQAMGRLGASGVDVFSVFQTEHEGGYGQFYAGFGLHGKGDALICGTLGHVTIHENWWNPIRATLNYSDGRVLPFNAPFTGGGFNYEITHFCQLLNNNLTESPVITHQLSRSMITMVDQVRALIGVKFDGD